MKKYKKALIGMGLLALSAGGGYLLSYTWNPERCDTPEINHAEKLRYSLKRGIGDVNNPHEDLESLTNSTDEYLNYLETHNLTEDMQWCVNYYHNSATGNTMLLSGIIIAGIAGLATLGSLKDKKRDD